MTEGTMWQINRQIIALA